LVGWVSRVTRLRFRISVRVSRVRIRVIRWAVGHTGGSLNDWPKIIIIIIIIKFFNKKVVKRNFT